MYSSSCPVWEHLDSRAVGPCDGADLIPVYKERDSFCTRCLNLTQFWPVMHVKQHGGGVEGGKAVVLQLGHFAKGSGGRSLWERPFFLKQLNVNVAGAFTSDM